MASCDGSMSPDTGPTYPCDMPHGSSTDVKRVMPTDGLDCQWTGELLVEGRGGGTGNN